MMVATQLRQDGVRRVSTVVVDLKRLLASLESLVGLIPPSSLTVKAYSTCSTSPNLYFFFSSDWISKEHVLCHLRWVVVDRLLLSVSFKVLYHPVPTPNTPFQAHPAPSSVLKRSFHEGPLRYHGCDRSFLANSCFPTCHSSSLLSAGQVVWTRLRRHLLRGVPRRECGDHGMMRRVSTLWWTWIVFWRCPNLLRWVCSDGVVEFVCYVLVKLVFAFDSGDSFGSRSPPSN